MSKNFFQKMPSGQCSEQERSPSHSPVAAVVTCDEIISKLQELGGDEALRFLTSAKADILEVIVNANLLVDVLFAIGVEKSDLLLSVMEQSAVGLVTCARDLARILKLLSDPRRGWFMDQVGSGVAKIMVTPSQLVEVFSLLNLEQVRVALERIEAKIPSIITSMNDLAVIVAGLPLEFRQILIPRLSLTQLVKVDDDALFVIKSLGKIRSVTDIAERIQQLGARFVMRVFNAAKMAGRLKKPEDIAAVLKLLSVTEAVDFVSLLGRKELTRILKVEAQSEGALFPYRRVLIQGYISIQRQKKMRTIFDEKKIKIANSLLDDPNQRTSSGGLLQLIDAVTFDPDFSAGSQNSR